jgi:hypothetical protein
MLFVVTWHNPDAGVMVYRKERCIFLFTDLVMITSVSRKGTRATRGEAKKSVVAG